MMKHRPPPSKVVGREQQFERLLAAMGAAELNTVQRATLVDDLERIEGEYARRVVQMSKQPNRKLVRRYRAAVAKLLSLSKKVGSDFLAEIEEAGWSGDNPGADAGKVRAAITEHMTEQGHERLDLIAVLTRHGLDMDYWLKTTGEEYRRRDVRKLLVEPVVQVLAKYEITTSPKQRPRTQIFDALFDWVGIEIKFRPTSAGINAIARELADSASG